MGSTNSNLLINICTCTQVTKTHAHNTHKILHDTETCTHTHSQIYTQLACTNMLDDAYARLHKIAHDHIHQHTHLI